MVLMSRFPTSKKITGLSTSAITHSYRRSQRTSGVLTASAQKKRMEAVDAKRQSELRGMSQLLYDYWS
jgi:hypothetical protein